MRNWKLGMTAATAALATLVGCSTATKELESADQKQIYQQYSVAYVAKEDKTSVYGQFREGGQSGETFKLTKAPAKLEHDSIALKESWELGTRYSGDKTGFVKSNAFKFTDAAGKTYINTFLIPEAKLPEKLEARVAGDKALTLAWVGEPIADEKDTVTLLIAADGVEGNVVPAERISVSKTGVKQVEIPLATVQKYRGGKRVMHFERIRRVPLQKGTDVGGFAELRYVSTPATVEFAAAPKGDVAPKAEEPKKEEPKKEVPPKEVPKA